MSDKDTRIVRASQLMVAAPIVAHIDDTVMDATWKLLQGRTGVVPMVNEDGMLMGVISWQQVVEYVARETYERLCT